MKRLAYAAVFLATPISAQDIDLHADVATVLAPISEISSLPDALHCAGLFRSLALSLGEESDISAGAAEAEEYMATTGAMLWFGSEGTSDTTPDQVFEVLVPLINGVAALYMGQMQVILGDTEDPLQEVFFDQYTYCTAIHDALREDDGG